MSNPLELLFGSPPGKVQDPSQSPESVTNNNQHVQNLHSCSKPSRWWEPPIVTRTPQPQRSSSVIRFNHSSKCIRNHSQSHFDDESRMKTSGRCFLKLTRMSSMSKCQERWLGAGQTLFIEPPQTKEPLGSLLTAINNHYEPST
jgi:hypothetical protein